MLAALVIMLIAAVPARAVKQVEMPNNFGADDWAVNNWEEAVGYLKFLANDDTRKEMLKLQESDRIAAWDEFWKARDPEKKKADNVFRSTYFARVRYANENFGSILRPGWLTDRGETWIRLGEPRMLDKYPMSSGSRSLEVWNYWFPRDTYLVFLDRSGVGDYDLLNYGDMIDEVYIGGK
ncbi:MAG TPA: GWxTD domain-containing protein [Candidatus Glassbacteria bacterium]|nr:GWxTD domain-containing protein [Candidatus Glassbacteria bacterium]